MKHVDVKNKLVRITTVPVSLNKLLEGQLSYMSNHFVVTAISSPGDILKEVGVKENVEVVGITLTRKITPLQDLKSLLALYKYLKVNKPEIVHTHTPKAGLIGMLASFLANTPNRLHTVAGLPLLEAVGVKRKILNLVEKITYACATKVYPNSLGLKAIIINQKFAKATKLKVIGKGSSNGIDTAHFNPKEFSLKEINVLKQELDIDQSDFVFIFVGRIVGDKGVNELIRAFSNLKRDKVKLLLLGDLEPDLDPLEKETELKIKNNSNIISLGFKQDVRPYFAISNVLVFPSYREGFPNVVMQAGAMGKPSIVSNINGCNEIIKQDFNGKIVPVKDTKSIEKEMHFFLDNKNKLMQMSQNARPNIVSNYEQKYIWSELLKEYKNL